MSLRSDLSRITRIKIWILVLALLPAAGMLAAGSGRAAAGLAAGGLIILLNLLGTQHAVWNLVEGQGVDANIPGGPVGRQVTGEIEEGGLGSGVGNGLEEGRSLDPAVRIEVLVG